MEDCNRVAPFTVGQLTAASLARVTSSPLQLLHLVQMYHRWHWLYMEYATFCIYTYIDIKIFRTIPIGFWQAQRFNADSAAEASCAADKLAFSAFI